MKSPLDVISGARPGKAFISQVYSAATHSGTGLVCSGLSTLRSLGPNCTPIDASGYRLCLIALPIIAALSACSQPIVRVQYVPTKVYLAIPAELTLPVTVDLTGMTYGEGLGSLRAGLETCNGKLSSIATLKPPPTL